METVGRTEAPAENRAAVRSGTAHSRELGEELRRVRRRAALSAAVLSESLGWSPNKLNKLETGSRGAAPWEIGALVGRCGADKATRDHILALTAEPDTGSFLRLHDTAPDALTALSVHERAATAITCYEAFAIPALAQTADYTRALTGDDDLVRARAARQAALRAVIGPLTTLYVHEAALRMVVGGTATMRDQVRRLALVCGAPGTTVHVVPATAPAHEALLRPAALLAFPAPTRPLAVVETDTATAFHEDPRVVARYEHKMRCLRSLALPPVESAALVARYADDYARRAGAD
ncbi:DUF5753 domain-containing protein [Saccharothrix sp. Mg75]|uniref:DUF5753 domain-containing protein n=1 Tax=Saccharothrix sp. Mg75 TaxID=3445357 RepID=UPI003EF08199